MAVRSDFAAVVAYNAYVFIILNAISSMIGSIKNRTFVGVICSKNNVSVKKTIIISFIKNIKNACININNRVRERCFTESSLPGDMLLLA